MSPVRGRVRSAAAAFLGQRYLVVVSSALLFLVLGVAVLLVYQNAGIMLEQIQSDFNEQQLILARQAASQVDADLRDIELELLSLARGLTGASEAIERYGLLTLFERTRAKGVVAVALWDGQGRLRAEHHEPDAEPRSRFRPAGCTATGRVALGPLRVEGGEGREATVTSELCLSAGPGGLQSRLLDAKLNVTRLISRATGRIRSGRTGYAWAIDETGVFLSHPDREFIGRNAFEARQERQPYISFSEINRIMKEQMLIGREGTGSYLSGWHRGVEGQIQKLISFTPLKSGALAPGQVWSVAVVAPTTEVAEAVRRVFPRQFAAEVALILAMSVFGLLAFSYQRRLSRALERQVGRQEEYMSSILQNSIDAILFVDNDNRVQVWNRGAELIFGYRADEMVGQTFHRLIPPEIDAEAELKRIRQEADGRGFVRDYIAPRLTKDGKRITVDITRTPVRSKEGELIGSTVILRDVTEKTEWEQRIYHTEKLASIGNLAAGVAHEINNPLAIMLGFTDLLLERARPGSQGHEDLTVIAESGRHARKIVENLLGFARVTEGLEDTVDVQHCVRVVSNIVKNTLMTAKVELAIDVPEGLPRVRGDAREFQQVLFNLVNNAVAAMRDGGGRLMVSAAADRGFVHLTVTDTGAGIPERIKRRIFDPFFTTKNVGEGTGLGLSLCYGIVRKYGGSIGFTSSSTEDNPGGPSGTAFTVSMPVCEAEPAAEPSAAATPQEKAERGTKWPSGSSP